MTFQVSLDEWMEGRRLYARSRNRLWYVAPFLFAFILASVLWGFASNPDPIRALFLIGIASAGVYDWVWLPYRGKATFLRNCQDGLSRPITYEFSQQGYLLRSSTGSEVFVSWKQVKGRLEGTNVWILIVKDKKTYWFVLPKRVTQSEEGQKEWAVVDEVLNPHAKSPIAEPF